MTLREFLPIFQSDIAPHYLSHELDFDPLSAHGRLHILRCLFLADHLCKVYGTLGYRIDRSSVFFAVAFHDIARQENGIDLWESESADACRSYLVSMGHHGIYAKRTAERILKAEPFDGETQILHDVDVLDYMRFFTFANDHVRFREDRMCFLSYRDVLTHGGSSGAAAEREWIIRKALDFARRTETVRLTEEHDLLIDDVREAWR